jgi:hypothetical protein
MAPDKLLYRLAAMQRATPIPSVKALCQDSGKIAPCATLMDLRLVFRHEVLDEWHPYATYSSITGLLQCHFPGKIVLIIVPLTWQTISMHTAKHVRRKTIISRAAWNAFP